MHATKKPAPTTYPENLGEVSSALRRVAYFYKKIQVLYVKGYGPLNKTSRSDLVTKQHHI